MTIQFPNNLDNLTNPTGTDEVAVVSHAGQHADANDAIEALEAKVGVDNSAVTTTHDFKLSNVADGDKAVSLQGTETLTNKTLTSPTINNGTFNSPTMVTPALGTPSSGDLTNTTGNASGLTVGNSTQTDGIRSATTTVVVSGSTAPTSGQVLTATSSTNAEWQSVGGGTIFDTSLLTSSPTLNAWTDLDLSSIIGTESKMVMIKILAGATAGEYAFRKKGETHNFYSNNNNYDSGTAGAGLRSLNASPTSTEAAYIIVPTNSSGVVQYYAEQQATFSLESYW